MGQTFSASGGGGGGGDGGDGGDGCISSAGELEAILIQGGIIFSM